MKNGEFLTAPAGVISSVLAITLPEPDDVREIVLLITAVVCAIRSIWIAAKPAIAKIREAWKRWKEGRKHV